MMFSMFMLIITSFILIKRADEQFIPSNIEFWIAIAPLVLGYVILYFYFKRNDMVS